MKKYLIAILFILLFTFCSRYFIFTKHIAKPNPLSYIYHKPIESVREKVIGVFSMDRFHSLNFIVGYDSVEQKMGNLTDNENRNHYFINPFWLDSSGDAETYYNWWGKLKLIPWYHIALDSLSANQTRITIDSDPKVEAGWKISSNHGIPYIIPWRVSVKPSTVEEYQIIKSLGDQLGEKQMPPIQR